MRKTVIFAGEAGSGIDRTAQLFGRMLAEHGDSVFIYRDYASLIRGGHNFSVVTFGDDAVRSHDALAHAFVAFGKDALSRHKGELIEGGVLITAGDYGDEKAIVAPGGSGRHLANNASLGMLVRVFGLDKQKSKKIIESEFGSISGPPETAYDAGYEMMSGLPTKTGRTKAQIMDGGEAVAKAARDMGVDAAFYYPMTPATGAFARLEATGSESSINVFRMEDEIAAVNAALGASFAGSRVITGSSGGGLALMGEAISLAGMAELPLVVYAAQRLGPSTGVPTYTSQGDLKFILSLGQGEFPKLVLAPGDAEEAYQMTAEAFYFADKYRIPAFILSDKYIAESYFSVPKKMIPGVPKARFVRGGMKKGYKSYENTPGGYSPMTLLGSGNILRATSYEHDESGFTTEEGDAITLMNDKRKRKISSISGEISERNPVAVFGKGRKVLVSTGSTKGAILDAMDRLKGWKFVQIKTLEPFPKKEFLKAIKGASDIAIIENNATGLLAGIISENTGVIIKRRILKYDGRPFTASMVADSLSVKSKKK